MATSDHGLPDQLDLSAYAPGAGEDRLIRFAEDWLGVRLGQFQKELLRALEQHRRVVAVTGNGLGKSFGGGAVGGIASLFCSMNTTVNITSGSYGQLDDTIWKPLKSLHRQSPLPGRTLDNTRELRTVWDEGWYLKCLSPRNPSELEGRHNEQMVYLIEEADKPGITHEHIDSAASTLTDASDRLLVIANPPEDETNVVYDLMESPKWHTLTYSSLYGHNLRVEAGEIDDEKIKGLVELDEVIENWEEWNGEEWPGLETVRQYSDPDHPNSRDDLDQRWYRRRAGVMPPAAASAHRPFTVANVETAFNREASPLGQSPDGLGQDMARAGGDDNVLAAVDSNSLHVSHRWRGVDHTANEARIRNAVGDWEWKLFAIDANGEGSGVADRIKQAYPRVHRFDNGAEAARSGQYYDCWAESLAALGQFLKNGGCIASTPDGRRLREELLAAARVVEYEEQYYKTRGAEVLKATSKEKIKDVLGRSPDSLDAAAMACWASDIASEIETRRQEQQNEGRSNASVRVSNY